MIEAVRKALSDSAPVVPEAPRPLVLPVDEPEPFPLEALGPLRIPAESIQAHTRAPIAICAQAVLGAVALVGQAHANVVLPSGQVRPLVQRHLLIARPTTPQRTDSSKSRSDLPSRLLL